MLCNVARNLLCGGKCKCKPTAGYTMKSIKCTLLVSVLPGLSKTFSHVSPAWSTELNFAMALSIGLASSGPWAKEGNGPVVGNSARRTSALIWHGCLCRLAARRGERQGESTGPSHVCSTRITRAWDVLNLVRGKSYTHSKAGREAGGGGFDSGEGGIVGDECGDELAQRDGGRQRLVRQRRASERAGVVRA